MGWGGVSNVLDDTKLPRRVRKLLDKSFQAPILAEINCHGWVAGVGGRLDQMKLRLTQPSLGLTGV